MLEGNGIREQTLAVSGPWYPFKYHIPSGENRLIAELQTVNRTNGSSGSDPGRDRGMGARARKVLTKITTCNRFANHELLSTMGRRKDRRTEIPVP
jgi:hypothetical protein